MKGKQVPAWPEETPSPYPKDPSVILSAIQRFNELDLQKTSDDELCSRIFDIVNPVSVRGCVIPKKLYRVRKGGVLTTERDLWAPPVPSEGRISTNENGVLYTASDIYTATLEAGVGVGDEFSLITYRTEENTSSFFPFFTNHEFIDSNFSGADLLFMKIQRNFIDNLYLRHAPNGFEYLYRPTQLLSWKILNLVPVPGGVIGFVYASVANFRSGWNYAIKTSVNPVSGKSPTDKLVVESIQREVRREDHNENGRVGMVTDTLMFSDGKFDNGNLVYR